MKAEAGVGVAAVVDIAERSLSDSPFLDPTTAVQAIDRLDDCLRHLARAFHDGRYADAEGVVRLTVRMTDWDAYVHLAYDEIRQRRPVLVEQLRLLEPPTSDDAPR